MKVILASASPRRKELLEMIGIKPHIIKPTVNEERLNSESIADFLKRNTINKGKNVMKEDYRNLMVVSSDTIVVLEKTIIGKPQNRRRAQKILSSLSGKIHQVWTGIAILYQGEVYYDYTITEVTFTVISDQEIDHYLDLVHYEDKAGAYAIQGLAAVFIEKINGCYYNVMGFPLQLFYALVKKINPGITLL